MKTDIQLVITFALKKETPVSWLESHNIPVHTLKALRSGVLSGRNKADRGMLVVITGAGLQAGEEAAAWIKDNISPRFVLNIGTCGLINKKYNAGNWIRPERVCDESGNRIELDLRSPVPLSVDVLNIPSLISVKKASSDIPESWTIHDAIDMECFSEARVFNNTETSFHCIKFCTDYSDKNTEADFNRNFDIFKISVKGILSFLEERIEGVTVVVPVFNREKSIRRAVDSIIDQTLEPAEIIVVNDGSTDCTADILKSYGDKITCLNLPRNSGPSAARNKGVRHSKSEWIAFLDSDDRWEKDKLKNQLAYLRRYPFYLIMQSEEIWIRKGKRVNPCRHHKKYPGWIWGPSLQRCLISPSGVLLKKTLFQSYGGFDESLPACEDYDLWLKISRNHPVGLDSAFSIIKYGGHEDQLSREIPAMDRFRVRSLLGRLKHEKSARFRKEIIDILREKLTILAHGCEKRGKYHEADEYRSMLKSLSN